MLSRELPQRRIQWWMVAAAFLCLHAASVLIFRTRALELSSLFLTLAPLSAAIALFWRSRSGPAEVRRLFLLLSVACFVWTTAMMLFAREEIVLRVPEEISASSEIVFFMYGVPVLLAVCSLMESPRSTLFLWMDGVQVALMGFLTFMVVFNVIPFSHEPTRPSSVWIVVRAFNIENVTLAVAVTLRFIGAPPGGSQRRLFGFFGIFIWMYAACGAAYDAMTGPAKVFDLLVDAPWVLLAFLAMRDYQLEKCIPFAYIKSLSVLLDNATPTLFPASVVALGFVIARTHFVSGVSCIAISLFVYGIRSTLVQVDYQRAQTLTKASRDSMEVLSLTDALTGVPNRRHFDQSLSAEWNRASRQKNHLSLLMIDIDHFKYINDNFGHADGDICLRQIAHALNASLQREFDTLTRYGGEEFAAILPQTDRGGAEIVAHRMRAYVNGLKIRNCTPTGSTVTISIGIATRDVHDIGLIEHFIPAADRALYRAKRNGRDRTEFESLMATESLVGEEVLA